MNKIFIYLRKRYNVFKKYYQKRKKELIVFYTNVIEPLPLSLKITFGLIGVVALEVFLTVFTFLMLSLYVNFISPKKDNIDIYKPEIINKKEINLNKFLSELESTKYTLENATVLYKEKDLFVSLYFRVIDNSISVKNSDKLGFYASSKAFDLSSEQSKEAFFSKELKVEKIFVFDKVNYVSFIRIYEPIFIKKNISYSWKEESSKNIHKKLFPLTSFIIDNIVRILLIILFIFLFEKQGLLGNQEKYEIVLPESIKGDFDDLVGMNEIKNEILVLSDLINNREKYKSFGIERTFNFLFSGPPGTGKTRISTLLAKKLEVPLIIGTGNVETGFINGGANVIKELFKKGAELAKKNKHKMAIIFLDEAQTLLVKRGQSREKWADDSSNELLAQLDGVHSNKDIDIIFIAASNFDEKNHQFDEAMMRRFKKKIFFRLPNLEERRDIFYFYLEKVNKENIDFENLDLNSISEMTSGLSPALIETIVQEASLIAINSNDKINTKNLEKAFERIAIGNTDRKKTENQEKEKDIISKHELGHFVCEMQNCINTYEGYTTKSLKEDKSNIIFLNKENIDKYIPIFKENLKVLKISVESVSQINALGFVLNKTEEVKLHSLQYYENEIVSLYGGVASENVFSTDEGEVTSGSFNDIEKISTIFNNIVNKLGMYSNSKLNLNLIDNIDTKEKNTKIILEQSDFLFSLSVFYVENYKDLIMFLQEELLEKYVLNLEEILFLIEKFYKEKV